MESHRSLTTTAALIHGAGDVELLLLLLRLLDIVLVDGAGEVELLQVLLFDIICGATEVDYYSYSYLTLKVEQLVRFWTFVAD